MGVAFAGLTIILALYMSDVVGSLRWLSPSPAAAGGWSRPRRGCVGIATDRLCESGSMPLPRIRSLESLPARSIPAPPVHYALRDWAGEQCRGHQDRPG